MARTTGTLTEVARRCAVSPSTVSRVLNNSKHGRFSVSAPVRQKILRAARELNYRPSIAARNLAVGKTKLVAVLGLRQFLSDTVGPMERAASALAAALDQAGYDICLQLLSQRHAPFELPGLRVDGVVVFGAIRAEDLKPVEGSGVPYVSVNGVVGRRGSQVSPDDAGGTRAAVEHLLGLGHRRIAYFDFPSAGPLHPSVTERRDAFERLRKERRFSSPHVDLPQMGFDKPWDTYYEPFLRRAILDGGATAILVYSHHAAIALVRTAHDLGLSVPRDFSLICFNDEPVVRLFVPSLSAVDVPSMPLGEAAAELLLHRMGSAKRQPTQRITLEETLVPRESTAPPSADAGRAPRTATGNGSS